MDKFREIEELFCISNPIGYTREVVNKSKELKGGMPEILEQFYLKYGLSRELQGLQDFLILPDKYPAFNKYEHLIFFNENQGVCQAGFHKNDILSPDPSVYVSYDKNEWTKTADRVSDFLIAMFGYQASICLEYNTEEFYWITPEKKKLVESRFPKRRESIKNWINCEITLYGADNNARIALMDTGGDIQMNFAANNKESLEYILANLDGIGEAI